MRQTQFYFLSPFSFASEIMKEAGSCLVNLLKDLVKMDKGRTRLECRTIVERRALQLFFCPHSKTRTLLVNFLLNTLDVQDVVSPDLHINHLMSCSEYRAQSLEISNDKIHTGQNCFIHKGMFQRRKVMLSINVSGNTFLQKEWVNSGSFPWNDLRWLWIEAILHQGGPQVGEVTRLVRVTRLFI